MYKFWSPPLGDHCFIKIWPVVSEKSLDYLTCFGPALSRLGGQTLCKYKLWSPQLGDHYDQVSSKSDHWFQRRSWIYELFTHMTKVDRNISPEVDLKSSYIVCSIWAFFACQTLTDFAVRMIGELFYHSLLQIYVPNLKVGIEHLLQLILVNVKGVN